MPFKTHPNVILRDQLDQFFLLWDKNGLLRNRPDGLFAELVDLGEIFKTYLPSYVTPNPDQMELFPDIDRRPVKQILEKYYYALWALRNWIEQFELLFVKVAAHPNFKVWQRALLNVFFEGLRDVGFTEFLPIGLLFFDLDNFKGINSRYGKSEGDRAIVAVKDEIGKEIRLTRMEERRHSDSPVTEDRRTKSNLRKFPDFISLAFSGDEFVIVMSRIKTWIDLIRTKTRLEKRLAVMWPIFLTNQKTGLLEPVQVSVTFGHHLMESFEENLQAIFARIERE